MLSQENPIAERVMKLRRIGREIDSFEVEKLGVQKYRFDLFEDGAFVESSILHCRDEDFGLKLEEVRGVVLKSKSS